MKARRDRPRRGRSFYERSLTAAEQAPLREALIDADEVEGVDPEIALLRAQVRLLLQRDPIDLDHFQGLMRLLLQAVATRHRISPRQASDLGAAVANVLERFGHLMQSPEKVARA